MIKNILRRLIQLQRVFRFFAFDSLLLIIKAPKKIPRSLLVVQIEGIGDYILSRNFFEALQTSQRFKNYSITFCGNESCKNMAEAFDSKTVTDFIWIKNDSFKRYLFYRLATLKKIRRQGFEVVINPVYSRDSLLEDSVVRAAGAREVIGYRGDYIHAKRWERNVFDSYYTELIDISPAAVFEFYKTKEFFEKILNTAIPLRKPSLPVLALDLPIELSNYAVICPGAYVPKRRWYVKNFIQTADYLHSRYNISSVFVGGVQDKPSPTEQQAMDKRLYITNFIGAIKLPRTVALIQKSILVVSNDTGIAHIGAAADVPVVVVSNGNHFGRFTEYPKDVYESIFYAYPSEIAQSNLPFQELVDLFDNGSMLDINSIPVDKIFPLIDRALH